MSSALVRRSVSLLVALTLAVTLFAPVTTMAAQDEATPEAEPAASPTPDRAPSYQRGHPAGALRLPGEPPTIGSVIMEDSLTGPGVFPGRRTCTSGRNVGEFVGEGFMMKVTGRCSDMHTTAMLTLPPNRDLIVPDGEVSFEGKVVSGHDRAYLFMLLRIQNEFTGWYGLDISPGLGSAALYRATIGAPAVPLAGRRDLGGRLSRDGWNQYAVRLIGPALWILVNEQPILSVSDPEFDRGWIAFGVYRSGNVDDSDESAIVIRNLRVSQLAERP